MSAEPVTWEEVPALVEQLESRPRLQTITISADDVLLVLDNAPADFAESAIPIGRALQELGTRAKGILVFAFPVDVYEPS